MAESAVNISSIQHKKPNIFELVAQESLMEHLHPSFKALCLYTVENNPSLYASVLKYFEEIYLSVNFILQYSYLKAFNASFSEAFYGLRRIKAFSGNAKAKLPPKVFAASLVFLVFSPYLNNKLNLYIETYQNEELAGKTKNAGKLERLLKLRKFLNTTGGLLKVYYLISYMSGRSAFHDPFLKLSGAELVCKARPLPDWRALLSGRAPLKFILRLGVSALELGAFFIQFLSWWHTKAPRLSQLPIVKPPHPPNSVGSQTCPICLKKRKNEVVLLTSGYVFCYLCIKDYLDRKSVCPVTLLPSSPDNLVRIYSD